MVDFDQNDLFETNPKEEMVNLINQTTSNLRKRMNDIKEQIESVRTSVDREQSRYSSIATELRSIKENIDTVPREDIRDKYDEALDVRFRLATMRGQQEKFEASHDLLEQQLSILQQISSQLQGVEMSEGDNVSGGRSGGLDVVEIIRTQEDERDKLARAMHDGPAQSLTNFILQAEIVQKLFTRYPDRAGEELDGLKANASKTFQKVRDFIFDLSPMMLKDLGAAPTVKRYAESYKEKNDIDVQLEIFGDERRRLENYREVMIFRGVQEAMSMARDYASPTEIDVQLDMSGDTIHITVEDNGRGFDAQGIFESAEEGTYTDARVQALRMLKSRFELIEGSLEVRSDENEGTTVRMELPSGA